MIYLTNKNFYYFQVDTNYGVKCPLKPGLYEKLDSKANNMHKVLLHQEHPKQSIFNSEPKKQEPCKYLTQTQTLQVSCQNDQQYSLRTKLCYPNQQDTNYLSNIVQNDSPISHTQYTQIESEINLVCLAHWKHGANQVIVSRTMSNEILCSVSFLKKYFMFKYKEISFLLLFLI